MIYYRIWGKHCKFLKENSCSESKLVDFRLWGKNNYYYNLLLFLRENNNELPSFIIEEVDLGLLNDLIASLSVIETTISKNSKDLQKFFNLLFCYF